jgi:hypothetical protein
VFCPKCRAEYVEGIDYCSECEKKLVEEYTEVVDNQEFVTIVSTLDRGMVAIAKSVLQSENIPYFIKGEMAFGFMPFATFNPMEIQVPENCENTSRELLSDLINNK